MWPKLWSNNKSMLLANLHEHSFCVFKVIAASLINGRFQGKQGYLKNILDSLALFRSCKGLTGTKLEGALLVMWLELERKDTLKKIKQLQKNFQCLSTYEDDTFSLLPMK